MKVVNGRMGGFVFLVLEFELRVSSALGRPEPYLEKKTSQKEGWWSGSSLASV
jgi:hypothetical protein